MSFFPPCFDGYLDLCRYYSRRSRSRERDSLSRSSSRSHHEEHDVRRSSHRERHTSESRKRLKTPEEKNREEETNSQDNQREKDRTHDTDPDEDWSDQGRERMKHRDRTRKSSKHRKETSGILDNFGDHVNRTGGADSDGDFLDEERERGRHRRERKKSPGKQKEFSVSPNGQRKSRSRTHDSDHTEDRSDGDRDRRRSRRREGSRNSKEDSGLSDDHGELEKINRRDSNLERVEIQRVKRRRHSTKWDRSSTDNIEADSQDDCIKPERYDRQRGKLHDHESRYVRDENIEKMGNRESEDENLGKQKRPKRKLDCDNYDDNEPSSRGRYSRRSESRDSKYNPDEKVHETDRWEPEIDSPERKHKSRSRDGERRPRRSRRSSNGKYRKNLDKVGSAEELQESEDNNKRYKRNHGHNRDSEN